MCSTNNNGGDSPNKPDDALKELRDQLKAEEAKQEKKGDVENATSETTDEIESTLEDIAGKKVSQFYVLKFDKPVFPESTFELTDNKYVNEFS